MSTTVYISNDKLDEILKWFNSPKERVKEKKDDSNGKVRAKL